MSRILTGIQATGTPHLGNLLGAIIPAIELSKKSESIFIGDDWIADVKGAQNFRMEVIFFDALRENKTEEGLKIIQNLDEIRKYL